MKLGNKTLILSIKFFFLITYNLYGNEEISTSQLINIEKIKPSFEEVEEKNETSLQNQKDKDIKQKRKTIKKFNGMDGFGSGYNHNDKWWIILKLINLH